MPAKINWTPELEDEFCDQVAAGNLITDICDSKGFPTYKTFRKHRAESDDFSKRIVRACEDQMDYYADRIMRLNDGMTAANWQYRNAQIRNIQWLMGKLRAAKYGDKLAHTGADGEGPIQIITSIPRPPK